MKRKIPLIILVLASLTAWGQQYVIVDPGKPGKTFEGIGALSAGASSRLLIDYPEPARSDILDWLFKPGYGAAFHHLKVETGGDVNSTDGTEPSIAHTRQEFDSPETRYYQRGYEFWLMKEAKKRNPGIYLDILQWGAPGWIGNGDFFSQDNADFIIRFIRKAKEIHGLDIDYCGVWNERPMGNDRPRNVLWVKLLKSEITRNNLKTKVVAMDEVSTFNITRDMLKDPEVMEAVDILGSHYQSGNPLSFNGDQVRQTGKPVWSSEDGPWRGDWAGAKALARLFNRNYISFGMTKTIIWSLVTSYYDILPIPGSGIMRANTPWSGFYEVQPALWAVAHFTHFAQPGWRYIDQACGLSADSTASYTTMISPGDKDISMIIETSESKTDQDLVFSFNTRWASRDYYLWKSDSAKQFAMTRKIRPSSGEIRLMLQKGCIFTLTTCTGDGAGAARIEAIKRIPKAKAFPVPYTDNFESYTDESLPKYSQDQAGVFEVNPGERSQNRNKILRQAVPGMGIEWHYHLNPQPYTILGDQNMRDYSVGIDVRLEKEEQFATIMGRIIKVSQVTVEPPHGYWFRVGTNGHWILGKTGPLVLQDRLDLAKSWPLLRLSFPDHTRNFRIFNISEIEKLDPPILDALNGVRQLIQSDPKPETLNLVVNFDGFFYVYRDNFLQEGDAVFPAGQWNNLKMRFQGDRIFIYVNGLLVVRTSDPDYKYGMAGFGCGWHTAEFDNLEITKEE